jgi:hypothetical protein
MDRSPRALLAARALELAMTLVPAGCGGEERGAPPRGAGVRYAAAGRPTAEGVRPRRRLDVLWIVLDTVRADAFAPSPDGRPLLAETAAWLAANTVAFTQASSPAPWTGPAVASILTGLVPSRHGARELSETFTLAGAVATAPEILGAQGWQTVAYTGGGWVAAENGVLQGVASPLSPFSFAGAGAELAQVFEQLHATSPWFILLHTYEAHDPYMAAPARPGPTPPPPRVDLAAIDREAAGDGGRSLARRFFLDGATREVVFGTAFGGPRKAAVTRWFEHGFRADPQGPAFAAEIAAVYAQGLRRLDRALAAFLRSAARIGALDNAVLVVTADHGEGFGEHGTLHHGRRLYDELVHVPLFVRAPGWTPGRVVATSCSTLDLLPTVLDLVGLPPAADLDGRSLAPLVDGAAGRPVVAEERRTGVETGGDDDALLVSVRDEARKWILTIDRRDGRRSTEAYDLRADPGETRPLADDVVAAWPQAFRDAIDAARATR